MQVTKNDDIDENGVKLSYPFVFLLLPPTLAVLLLHVAQPSRVIRIPLNGFPDAALERSHRLPSQLPFNLARINGITAVVTGAIHHEGNLLPVAAGRFRREFIHQITQRLHDLRISSLDSIANVVRPPGMPPASKERSGHESGKFMEL
jgi:hypothetical protein